MYSLRINTSPNSRRQEDRPKSHMLTIEVSTRPVPKLYVSMRVPMDEQLRYSCPLVVRPQHRL